MARLETHAQVYQSVGCTVLAIPTGNAYLFVGVDAALFFFSVKSGLHVYMMNDWRLGCVVHDGFFVCRLLFSESCPHDLSPAVEVHGEVMERRSRSSGFAKVDGNEQLSWDREKSQLYILSRSQLNPEVTRPIMPLVQP